jgi:cellulose synthase/poly-beta-1,6-N-acetylglucosamine synthase-like glycosyltransferase
MLIPAARPAVLILDLLMALYFIVWSVSQIAMGLFAVAHVRLHQLRNTRRARALVVRMTSPPLVSVVAPAYNEQLTIEESVRAMLALDYESSEIVIVNDGSTDDTLAVLTAAFRLVPAPLAFAQPLRAAPVRGAYRSMSEPALLVIDKENGRSKADAVNAGINAASGALVLVIDADTILERDALSRAVLPFLEDSTTVAVGGTIGIANGCRIQAGRMTDISLPKSWLARFQIVEYMRGFLLFRLACASGNAVVLISGAFGLFRRDVMIAVGGYDPTAIGEDMDVTVRIQRYCRELRRPFRITFDPNPLAWTQAPEDWRSLEGQRCRWRRGLHQVLWRHRGMIANPRFGLVGLAVLPHVAFIEGMGPLFEMIGYAVVTAAAIFGLVDWRSWGVLMAIAVLCGTAVTFVAVLMSDVVTRKYMRRGDLALLIAVVILENCGYRQLNAWWGLVGTFQSLTGKGGWGVMKRKAFDGI